MITPIIHRFEQVGSTNDVALDMARSGAPEGTVIITRSQTKGRGRRGRSWTTKPGENIMMTVIVRPSLPLCRYSLLAIAAAVAVADSLVQAGVQPRVKWPNDVLINDKKCTGILVEATPGAAVIGIGININQTAFPPELAEKATSLALETGVPADVDRLTDTLISRLFDLYQQPFEEILPRWRNYMWGIGRLVTIDTGGETISGEIRGVDSDGALLLDQSDGVRRVVAADAITPVR